jgi:hypothetical protein
LSVYMAVLLPHRLIRLIGVLARRESAPNVAVALVFLLMATTLIVAGRGLPFSMDGNETYSSMLHARNIVHFGVEKSAGLADDATGLNPEAHPVVHTHQGNFPRVFATILYVIGITSPEGQIIFTTLIVGLTLVMLLLRTLRRHFGLGIALAALMVMISDYVFFGQWALVTYRIWLPFFLACTLAVTDCWYRVADKPLRTKLPLLLVAYVLYLAMFYYELIFMTFIAVSAGIWNFWLNRKRLHHAFLLAFTQLVGAITGASLVVLQLIYYLGWDDFLLDLKLTYGVRNEGVNNAGDADVFQAFAEQHNIAAFRNFQDGSLYRTFDFFRDMFFKFGFGIYSPVFVYGLMVLTVSVLIALYWRKAPLRFVHSWLLVTAAVSVMTWFLPFAGQLVSVSLGVLALAFFLPRHGGVSSRLRSVEATLYLLICGISLLLAAFGSTSFLGFEVRMHSSLVYLPVVAFAAAIYYSRSIVRSNRFGLATRNMSTDQVVRGGLLLMFAAAFAGYHHALYDTSWVSVWHHSGLSTMLQRLFLLIITVGALLIAMCGPEIAAQERTALRAPINKLLILLVCFLVGLITVQILFPGYLYSGYMARQENILFLPFALFIAAILWVIWGVATATKQMEPRYIIRNYSVIPSIIYTSLILLVAMWLLAQITLVRAAPPTAFYGLASALRSLAPEEATIVSNTYTAPFTMLTGNWSYSDSTFAQANITRDVKHGYGYEADGYTLWQADRKTNPDYARPAYYVCFMPTLLSTAAYNFNAPHPVQVCSNFGLGKLAIEKKDSIWPEHELVDEDGPKNRWMLVKLDWDFSPYFSAPVAFHVQQEGASTRVSANYSYRQQERVPEAMTQVSVYRVSAEDKQCKLAQLPVKMGQGHGGLVALTMPTRENMTYIALVQAHTKTRASEPAFSAPFSVVSGRIRYLPACEVVADALGKQWKTTLWDAAYGESK